MSSHLAKGPHLVALDLGMGGGPAQNPIAQFMDSEKIEGGPRWIVENDNSIGALGVLENLKGRPEIKSVRFAEIYFDGIMAGLNLHSPDMINTGSADCLIRERSGWWSMSLLRKALIWGAGQYGKVDIRKSALFCGDSRSVGAIMSMFVHVGYSDIYWYSGSDSVRETDLVAFRKNHFGARIHPLSTEDFRMMGPVCSMVVLKTMETPSKALVEEMNYFNYLSAGGVLFDANWEIISETFDQQVVGQDFHFINSKTMRNWLDQTWVEALKVSRVV